MDIQKQNFRAESAFVSVPVESIVEGRLKLPVEKSDIERVLMINGSVHADASPSDDKIYMDGDVTFSVVYLAADGSIDSFEASSPFRHSEELDGADADTNIYLKGSIKETQYSVEDSRSVYVKGIVSLSVLGSSINEYCAAAALENMQVKTCDKTLSCTKEFRRDAKTIAEDIRVPQTLPRVEKILMANAYPVIKSVKTQELKIIVEGDIKMMILYLSEDKNAPLQHFYDSVPFGEIVACESAGEDETVQADAELFGVQMSIADEDVLRLSAKMDIYCSVKGSETRQLIKDAYSLKGGINVKTDTAQQKTIKLSGCAKAIARATLTIPEEKPAVNRIVCLQANPVVLSSSPGTDRIYIEGVMMYTLCYFSPDGMQSFCSDVPFEAEAQMEGMQPNYDAFVSAETEYATFDGAGRDISVKFMLDTDIKAFENDSFSMVTDAEETEEIFKPKTGITIYFADGGESLWDIAKRYSVTPETVEKFNPDVEEQTYEGQKILIMG